MDNLIDIETRQREVTILYVDDEEMNLLLFEMNFQGEHQLFLAKSGPEGLEILKEKSDSIVVVISDFRMPYMNGLEFIEKAREFNDHIIYFMLTAFAQSEEIQQAVKEKVIYACLEKPLNVKEIESRIEEALKTF